MIPTCEANRPTFLGVVMTITLAWLDDPVQREERDGQNSIPLQPYHYTKGRVTQWNRFWLECIR
jgi:hypothetical protein